MKRNTTIALAALLVAGGVLVERRAAADDSATATVGAAAPEFTLKDLTGAEHQLSQYTAEGKVVVLEWFNPDCPFVKKHHQRFKTMKETQARYAERGVVWLAINSGAAGKQGAGLERNQKAVTDYEIAYPVLLDENGAVGRLYGARTTPHMFVIDAAGVLRYAGAIDDDSSPAKQGATNYVAAALDSILSGSEVASPNTRPYGCSVKYASN